MSEWIDCGNYWEYTAPQRDTEGNWARARLRRITASNAGAAAGHSHFKKDLREVALVIAGIKQEDFSEKSKYVMQHGTDTEPQCRDWYCQVTGYKVRERGLIVPKWDVFLGASVDGDIEGTDGLIEIKCPLTMYKPLQNYTQMIAAGWQPPLGYHEHIWPTHYDQMMQCMAVMGKKWCDYIVYCTEDRSVFTQKIPFDPNYWSHVLYPKLNDFKKNHLFPLLTDSNNQLLYPLVPI